VDLWQITLIVLRRWYVFIPLCLLAYLGVQRASESVQTEYQTEATVLLVGPVESTPVIDPTKPVRVNPYLSQGLTGTGQALQAVMTSQHARVGMAESGGSPAYEVVASNRNPLLTMTVTAPTAQMASETSKTFPKQMARELDRLQDEAGAPRNQRVSVQALTVGDAPIGVRTGLRKAQAIAGGLGLGIAVGASLALEALLIAWRRRRGTRGRRRSGAKAAAVQQVEETPVAEPDPVVEPERQPQPADARAPEVSATHRPVSVSASPAGSLRD
jgi:hypothetical protein